MNDSLYKASSKEMIQLTLRGNKWSGIGCTPTNVMHIIRVKVSPKVVGSIIFVALVTKANRVTCKKAPWGIMRSISLKKNQL